MIQPDFESLGVVFNHESPILTAGEALDTYEAWWANQRVACGLTAIAKIRYTNEELAALRTRIAMATSYNQLALEHPLAILYRRVAGLLSQIVHYDAQLGDRSAEGSFDVFGGYYRANLSSGDSWRCGSNTERVVHYAVAAGAPLIEGLRGTIGRQDIYENVSSAIDGTVLSTVSIGPRKQLQVEQFDPGTVVRYTIDPHGHNGTGIRVEHQATVLVQPPR